MNRLWIAALTGALVLALCITGERIVTGRIGDVLEAVERTQAAAFSGTDDALRQCADDAEALWQKNAVLLGSLLRHDESDGITAQLAQIRVFAQFGSRESVTAVCAAAIGDLEHIRSMELPLVENVL